MCWSGCWAEWPAPARACAINSGTTRSEVAALAHPGWDTFKEIVKADLGRRYAHIPLREVRRLAIDEIHLGRKMKAAIVFDHFHIIKLANEKIDDLRRTLQREAEVLGYQTLKGSHYLLLTGSENLTGDRRDKLAEALRLNQPLSTAYYLKEELRLLWNRRTRDSMRRFLERWIARASGSGIRSPCNSIGSKRRCGRGWNIPLPAPSGAALRAACGRLSRSARFTSSRISFNTAKRAIETWPRTPPNCTASSPWSTSTSPDARC